MRPKFWASTIGIVGTLPLVPGGVGYLLKNAIRRDLADAIRGNHAGPRHVPLEVAAALGECAMADQLSARETDLLRQLCQEGGSNKRIGDALGMSEDTVKSHMKNILLKLDASDRTQTVVIALRRGILDLWDHADSRHCSPYSR